MDRLDAMRLFTRVVERRSFTQAANDIGLPRSTATQVIHQLERRVGVRLLQRTTRVVRPTLDGEAYYRRCLAILQDIEDAEGAFAGAKPKGALRIEVQGTLARHFLMPNLPAFFAQYPDVEISMSESDRWVDLVHEGVDSPFSVTGPESYLLATRLGLGLAQMPHFHIAEDLKRGSLVPVLANCSPPSAPVSLMYAQNRQLSPRVRVFSDWLAQQFGKSKERPLWVLAVWKRP
jgi:DNA-binding transcriptional LysR family regulator